MRLYTELPAGAQAAYSGLYEVTRQTEQHRSISGLNGTIQFQDVAGKRYACFAYRDAVDGRLRQRWPVTPGQRAQPWVCQRHRQALPHHPAVVRRQVLHGWRAAHRSHAFQALAGMLGVSWFDGTHALDVDFAHPGARGNISVALPANLAIDVHSAIDALKMGFLPGLALRGGGTTSSYASAREPDLRLDFLTPARRDDRPIQDPVLKVALQPLKFLDYLIEQSVQGSRSARDRRCGGQCARAGPIRAAQAGGGC